jgi:transcriptional regulator with XRE-family HTH domain
LPLANEVIREARRRAGLTQSELARRLDISQAAIAQLEAAGSNPTVDTLDRVLHATGHRLEVRAEPTPGGVDETLIARQLEMTAGERLSQAQAAYDEVRKLAGAAKPDGK